MPQAAILLLLFWSQNWLTAQLSEFSQRLASPIYFGLRPILLPHALTALGLYLGCLEHLAMAVVMAPVRESSCSTVLQYAKGQSLP